jgi:hypothetical protein
MTYGRFENVTSAGAVTLPKLKIINEYNAVTDVTVSGGV